MRQVTTLIAMSILGLTLSGCAVASAVGTVADVAGSVVSTTADVAGSAVSGVASTVSGGSSKKPN